MSLPSNLTLGSTIKNQSGPKISTYQIRSVLGQGGFGTAFEVVRTADAAVAEPSCLKVTDDARSWHGEAYFGEFLKGSRRAVQQIDAFPFQWTVSRQRVRMLYAIESEYITTGTVYDAVRAGTLKWPPARVGREIRLLLETVDQLHINGTWHRDITPKNVFVGPRGALKIGDFGIARMRKLRSGVIVDAYSPAFKPPHVGKYWQASDDVYQVGLLALTLLSGTVMTNDVKKPIVNQLVQKDDVLRDVIKKAISSNRRDRYQHAEEMAMSLRT